MAGIYYLLIVLFSPAVLGQDKAIIALQDNNGRLVWTDGEEFDKNIKVFEPNLPTSDWRMLGQIIQLNNNNLETPVYRFRENLRSGENNIQKPFGFTWIWDDRLSYASKDASVWRVSCPDEYIAFSDVFYDKIRINNPVQLFDKFGCVKLSLAERCRLGEKLWDDSGSGATYDIGIWQVAATADQLPGGFFANSKQNDPPTIQPYCLKKSSYDVI